MSAGDAERRGEAVPRMRADNSRRVTILRRATEIFEHKGFEHTTIEDISDAVGVTREAIYYYFRDKTDILVEIIKPESDYLLHSAQRIAALDLPARDRLVLAVENHMMRFNPNYLEMAIAVREMGRKGGGPRIGALRNVWRRYAAIWVRMMEDGRIRGDFAPELDPRLAAFAILGMCNSASVWFDPREGVPITRLSETFVRIATRGVLAEPGTRTG